MRITRKSFISLATAGATGALLSTSRANAGQAKSTKSEKAAIKGTTDALTAFIMKAELRSMPADVVAQAKRCLVDGFGVILAGSTVKGSAIVPDYVRTVNDRKESTAVGAGGFMTSAAHAALINAASGHAMDYDDTQLSTTPDRTFGLLTHPTVPALSAALAIAERIGASGEGFLEAFLVGFEVECKIAEAIDPAHYRRGFHSTGTLGTFGAAAAAARLMKLTGPEIDHMLAITASVASGIRVNFGSMTKPLHAARAAENDRGVVRIALGAPGHADVTDVETAAPGIGQEAFVQIEELRFSHSNHTAVRSPCLHEERAAEVTRRRRIRPDALACC